MLTSSAVMSITNDLALSPHDRRSASQPPRRESATSNATRTRPHTVAAETSHTYISHLIEDGVDPTFVQRQAGHSWASTTAGYTTVGADHANRMLRAAVDRAFVAAPQGNSG
jgi:site-specific recombinase XerD